MYMLYVNLLIECVYYVLMLLHRHDNSSWRARSRVNVNGSPRVAWDINGRVLIDWDSPLLRYYNLTY